MPFAQPLKTAYMVDTTTPAGCCAVLVKDIVRSLRTNLMAANNFKVDHVKEPANMALLQQAVRKLVGSIMFW